MWFYWSSLEVLKILKQVSNQRRVSDACGKSFKNPSEHLDFCTVGFWSKNKKLNSWSIRVAVFIEWYEQHSLSLTVKFLVQENLQLMAFYNSKDIPFFMAQLGTCQTNLFPVGWPWSFTLSVLAYWFLSCLTGS